MDVANNPLGDARNKKGPAIFASPFLFLNAGRGRR